LVKGCSLCTRFPSSQRKFPRNTMCAMGARDSSWQNRVPGFKACLPLLSDASLSEFSYKEATVKCSARAALYLLVPPHLNWTQMGNWKQTCPVTLSRDLHSTHSPSDSFGVCAPFLISDCGYRRLLTPEVALDLSFGQKSLTVVHSRTGPEGSCAFHTSFLLARSFDWLPASSSFGAWTPAKTTPSRFP